MTYVPDSLLSQIASSLVAENNLTEYCPGSHSFRSNTIYPPEARNRAYKYLTSSEPIVNPQRLIQKERQ